MLLRIKILFSAVSLAIAIAFCGQVQFHQSVQARPAHCSHDGDSTLRK
jgi:hypothetical protein